MGYILLWIESLAVSLLLVATATAFLAQLGPRPSRWFARPVAALVALLPLAFYAFFLIFLTGVLKFWSISGGSLFFGLLALTAAYAVGAGCLLVLGVRQAEPALRRAAEWPRGRLTAALLIAAALHLMTFWNMDLAARQQLATLRTEAGALALSVVPPRVPDRDNAAVVYQQAFEAMGDGDANTAAWQWDKPWREAWEKRWTEWHGSPKIEFDLNDPELRRFLKREAAALALLRRAAAKSGCTFDRDYGRPSIAMPLPELNLARNAARLLALDAICRAADKDHRGASDDLRTMFRMAEHVGDEPILISMLVATVIDGMAADTLRHVMASGRLPPEELVALGASDDVSYRRLLRRALRFEEATRLAIFDQVGEAEISLAHLVGHNEGLHWSNAVWFPPLYRVFLLADDLASNRLLSERMDRIAAKPYYQAKPECEAVDKQLNRGCTGLLTRLVLPALTQCCEAAAVADARRRAVRLALAVERYRAGHGRFPARLEDLVPEFIPLVPLDPFDGQPMRMRRTGQRLIVYSIGPDLTDDGGAPLDKTKKTGDIPFELIDAGP